jgi:hypothetical protein
MSARPQLYLVIKDRRRLPTACLPAMRAEIKARMDKREQAKKRWQAVVNAIGYAGVAALTVWAAWVIWQALVIAWVVL